MTRPLANVAASVRQRLLNRARESGRPFAELLQYYTMERFLYRLAVSEHRDKFVLKGALMLRVWHAPEARPTMDIDLLGQLQQNEVVQVVTDVCQEEVEVDGLVFDPQTLTTEAITEDADYEGVRVRLRGFLGTARVMVQLDVGFGDTAFTEEIADYPSLLGMSQPRLRGYSRESSIAEKFEAMTKLGRLNSRMKDFYDIWLLSRQFTFEGERLTEAVAQTFHKRGTPVEGRPDALTRAFANDPNKVLQWRAFLRKGQLDNVPDVLSEVVMAIAEFLEPVATAQAKDRPFLLHWTPARGWQPEG